MNGPNTAAPLAIDLYCGLGGWSEGLLAEGWDVIGFDIEAHVYGAHRYPAQLVVQDVLTLNGAQFRDAGLIVASPPCQEYSYMAMPWTRAKQIAAALKGEGEFPEGYTGSRTPAELNALFDACFRIQREACAAAGRHVPMVVENVRGAQPWVGRARWNFGSYYLWGDVPALMPPINGKKAMKHGIAHRPNGVTNFHGHKNDGGTSPAEHGIKQRGAGHAWFDKALDERRKAPGGGADGWFGKNAGPMRRHSSGSTKRKFASAMIAKIPPPLARHIAASFAP